MEALMKRFIALLLAAMMVLPLFACANNQGDGEESKKPVSSSSSSGSGSTDSDKDESEMTYLEKLLKLRDQVDSGLTDETFGGYTVTIDCLHDENGRNYTADWIMKEEITSDQINNVLYERHQTIEEKFDVNLNYVYLEGTDSTSTDDYVSIRTTTIQAGLGEIDIIGVAPWATRLALEGIFEDMNELDYLDFSRPWWFTDTINDFTLDGHSIIAFGSCTGVSIFGGTEVCYFNQDLCENYLKDENGDPVDLYQLVRDGKWTYDYLYAIAKDYHLDMDGDEEISEGDLFGFKYNTSFIRLFWNLGGKYCEFDEATGMPTCNLNTSKNEDIFNKCRDLISLYDKDVDGKWFAEAGENKGILFYATNLTMIEDTGGYEFQVGILPMPKLNEEQENYLANGYLVGAGITIDSRQPNTSAAVLEALAYYGWYSVVPKYYETIVKYKYSSDSRNAEMLDLMYNNMYYDPIYMYSRDTIDYLANYCNNPGSGFASFIAKKNTVSKNTIKKNAQNLKTKNDKLFGTK